jgi:outer membrane lipoprotein-sorting protein
VQSVERGEEMLKKHAGHCLACILLAFFVSTPTLSETMSGEEIIKRVDKNRIFERIEYNGKMVIKKKDKVRNKLMHVYAEGEEKALIEFINPEDAGTRYLKLSDELWMYFPDAEEIVKISGHMLREGMMGSDFSYEDMVDNEGLLKKYSITVTGSEIIDERDCYVLELNAIEKKVTYAKQKIWVDKDRFVTLKGQLFARSGKLLKEILSEKVQKYGDRYFPTKVTMINKVVKDSSTMFEMEDINFGVDIPDGVFTKRYLER